MKKKSNPLVDEIALEIQNLNYWEHYKAESDLARSLGSEHPKRLRIAKHSAEILEHTKSLQKKIKGNQKS